MALPFLLTTAACSLGASTQLIQILNRFGAAVSINTHEQIPTFVANQRILTGVQKELMPSTLSIVSINNINILLPHSMVSSTQTH